MANNPLEDALRTNNGGSPIDAYPNTPNDKSVSSTNAATNTRFPNQFRGAKSVKPFTFNDTFYGGKRSSK